MKESQTISNAFEYLIRSKNRYSAKNNVKPVNFYCVAPQARTVSLVGEFNGWNPLAHPMYRQFDGTWTARVELHHGYHQYQFLVDGEPMLDPNACGIARNAKSEQVSLIAVS
jgi:1,4-alpha-glucan branching enzyme